MFLTFKREVYGSPKYLENFHTVFTATDLHPDTLFFLLFLIFKQSWQQCKAKKLHILKILTL